MPKIGDGPAARKYKAMLTAERAEKATKAKLMPPAKPAKKPSLMDTISGKGQKARIDKALKDAGASTKSSKRTSRTA